MQLRTLGGLELEGSRFRRVKPLLLAAYLALEGPRPRRYLAQVFWPGASDAMNSLSVALSQLRRGAQGSVEADESRAWCNLPCDAVELADAFAEGDLERVVELYQGPFLDTVDLELGEELEEWLYATRESLAAKVREAMLRLAEAQAARADFEAAARQAERAYELPGANEPEPEELVRFHLILSAGMSPAAAEVRREAQAYGVELSLESDEARKRLGQFLIGRDRELEQLAGLQAGEWAWLRGEAGMGKTSLLKQLEGVYLPARSGLPYATLEPLLKGSLGSSEDAILRQLARVEGTWLVDDWEAADEESRRLLAQLRSLRTALTVVITAREPAALPVDREIVLGPLPDSALGPYPDAWEQTGGLPELVDAFLREESLDQALERQLARIDEAARVLYLGFALLDEPDTATVRRALGMSGTEVGQALEELLSASLVEPSGQVMARQAALRYLDARPSLMGPLALSLARQLEGIAAFPLYRRARPFWEEADLEAVSAAYRQWSDELLRRGFARRAAEVLGEAPPDPENTIRLARSLEQAGRYKEALEKLEGVGESPLVSALKSALYWRLGLPREAEEAARRGVEGDAEARAEALNTLGVLARSREEYREAESLARRAAALWKTLGNRVRWVGALNNLAIVRTLSGESGDLAFREALQASTGNGLLEARTLLNLGWAFEREERMAEAERAYRQAAEEAADAGVIEVAAWGWNNLGVLNHKQLRTQQARDAYENALALAQRAGEQRILGMVMANLAELDEDPEAWQEALRILEKAGHQALAQNFRDSLPREHPLRSADNDQPVS